MLSISRDHGDCCEKYSSGNVSSDGRKTASGGRRRREGEAASRPPSLDFYTVVVLRDPNCVLNDVNNDTIHSKDGQFQLTISPPNILKVLAEQAEANVVKANQERLFQFYSHD